MSAFRQKNMKFQNKVENTFKNNKDEQTLHPCQYCSTPCFGLQCKECHLKMVADNSANCEDCGQNFFAKKKDGSKHDKCFECRKAWYDRHFKSCLSCKENFRWLADNGRTFEMCGGCYKKASFHKCKNCKNTTHIKNDMCSACYNERRELKNEYMVSRCQKEGCSYRGKGEFKFCESHKLVKQHG